VSERGKGRQTPEYKFSHCPWATLRPCRGRCRLGRSTPSSASTRPLISAARLATSLTGKFKSQSMRISTTRKTRTKFKRGESHPNRIRRTKRVVNDYHLSFPRPGRSAPAGLIELPSYHETYVTPGPTAVGARALILLLWRSPQMLEEERNHVSVEFLVERCAVEAVPVVHCSRGLMARHDDSQRTLGIPSN
jgi:hypothetical protein